MSSIKAHSTRYNLCRTGSKEGILARGLVSLDTLSGGVSSDERFVLKAIAFRKLMAWE